MPAYICDVDDTSFCCSLHQLGNFFSTSGNASVDSVKDVEQVVSKLFGTPYTECQALQAVVYPRTAEARYHRKLGFVRVFSYRGNTNRRVCWVMMLSKVDWDNNKRKPVK